MAAYDIKKSPQEIPVGILHLYRNLGVRTVIEQGTFNAPVEVACAHHVVDARAVHHFHGCRSADRTGRHRCPLPAGFAESPSAPVRPTCRARHAAHGQKQGVTAVQMARKLLEYGIFANSSGPVI